MPRPGLAATLVTRGSSARRLWAACPPARAQLVFLLWELFPDAPEPRPAPPDGPGLHKLQLRVAPMGSSGVPVPMAAWTALPHWTELLMEEEQGPALTHSSPAQHHTHHRHSGKAWGLSAGLRGCPKFLGGPETSACLPQLGFQSTRLGKGAPKGAECGSGEEP